VPQHLDHASTLLWFGFPQFFCHFSSVFCRFSSVSSILLLDSSLFPPLSLFLCLVSLFSLYFFYLFLSTLSTTYRSYLQTVLCSSCLRSFNGRPILRRISILTTLVHSHTVTTLDLNHNNSVTETCPLLLCFFTPKTMRKGYPNFIFYYSALCPPLFFLVLS
jgi:hypothetical protein